MTAVHALVRPLALLLLLAGSASCKQEEELTPEQLAAKMRSDLKEAEARIRNNKLQDAEAIYLHIFEKDPEQPEALAGMAALRIQQGEYETAQVLLDRAIAAGNQHAVTQFDLGETYRLRQRDADAVGPYRKAFELDPENAGYGLALGIALKVSKQFSEAEKVLRSVAELDPNIHFVWTEIGDAVREQGRMDEALKVYMKAQNTYASDRMARAGAALVYESKGDIKHALDEWSAYIRMDCCSEYSNTVAKQKIQQLKLPDAPPAAGEAAPVAPAPG